ncbi:MAG TPA: two-component regulator propeller domain-containing protein, partial [Kofleriaceae bacterium]|nr:two-component regulator propeller domain-containing protein [Kofleriaceae bacterium]
MQQRLDAVRCVVRLAACAAGLAAGLGAGDAFAEPEIPGSRKFVLHPPIQFDVVESAELPHPHVTAIAQDSIGFLWIGTRAGLARFDGRTHRLWPVNPGDPSALASGNVTALAATTDGILWIGTDAGLHRYDARADRMTRVRALSDGRERRIAVTALHLDHESRLWIGTADGGLGRWDAATSTIQVQPIAAGSVGQTRVSTISRGK